MNWCGHTSSVQQEPAFPSPRHTTLLAKTSRMQEFHIQCLINHSRFPSKFPIGHLKEISPLVRLFMLFSSYSLTPLTRFHREWIGIENSNQHRRTSDQSTTTQLHPRRRISQSRNNICHSKHHWKDFIRQLCFLHPQFIHWIRIGGDSILHVGK